jgi:hypothetical protein
MHHGLGQTWPTGKKDRPRLVRPSQCDYYVQWGSAALRRVYTSDVKYIQKEWTVISYYAKISSSALPPSQAPPHALAKTTGGRPSGGRPRFLFVLPPLGPPPVPTPVPPAPVPAPGAAFFFFGVCGCGWGSPAGTTTGAVVGTEGITDAPSWLSTLGLFKTGVVGWTPPATTPVMTPTVTPGAVEAAVTAVAVLTVGAGAVAATEAAATAVSFGLAFFFEPPAAAMAALLGRITWPRGPSFACAGFGGSSGSVSCPALARRCSK